MVKIQLVKALFLTLKITSMLFDWIISHLLSLIDKVKTM